ncbi:MAG: hypothetical protein AB7O24_12745 [Kofleriaceae bacterium]
MTPYKFLLAALFTTACGTTSDGGPDGGTFNQNPDGGPLAECDHSDLTMTVTTLAGCNEKGMVDGARAVVRFSNPVNVAIAPSTVTYVADFDNNRLRAVESNGATSTIVQGMQFARPFGLAFAPNGTTLYVQTDDNPDAQHTDETGTVWRVDVNTGMTAVVARDIGRPRGIAVLSDGKIALADYVHHVVSILDPGTGAVTLLAGTRNAAGHANGTGAAAKFAQPYDVVEIPGGDLVVSDMDNHRLRRVTRAGVVSDYAGTGAVGGDDGPVATSTFALPQGLAIDSGMIYVSDVQNRTIRRVMGGEVTTIAGDGMPGFQDSNAPLTARFFGLEGIDVRAGRLVAADGNIGNDAEPYNRVRVIDLQKL